MYICIVRSSGSQPFPIRVSPANVENFHVKALRLVSHENGVYCTIIEIERVQLVFFFGSIIVVKMITITLTIVLN